MNTNRGRSFGKTFMGRLAVLALVVTGLARAAEPRMAEAISLPSEKLALNFQDPGIVQSVNVKDGARVQKGDVLAEQDTRTERKLLEAMKIEAFSKLPIEAARTEWDNAKVTLERIKQMHAKNAATDAELEESVLKARLGEIKFNLAQEENAQKRAQVERQELKLELMRLRSPIEGMVDKVNLGPGEWADPQNRDGAVVVVKNDPLWIEAHLPVSAAVKLKMGDTLEVAYLDKPGQWQTAKIVFFSPTADPASDTQLVRLEMANPQGHASGYRVQLKLPATIAGAAERLRDAAAVSTDR